MTATARRTTAAEYAHHLTAQLYAAEEAEEAARLASNAARSAAMAAERAYEDATEARKAAAPQSADLARALGWRGVGIIEDPPDHGPAWDEDRAVYLAAAFARGRAVKTKPDRGAAPRGRAYGWPVGQSAGSVTIYEPSAGTNNAEKLAGQYEAAQDALRAWLADYTAEAWLTAHGIKPDDAPPLVNLVAIAVEVHHRGWGAEAYRVPEWVLTLAGVPIARSSDTADMLDPFNSMNGHSRYEEARERFGSWDGLDDDGVRAWAVNLAPQMRDALVARFAPRPR